MFNLRPVLSVKHRLYLGVCQKQGVMWLIFIGVLIGIAVVVVNAHTTCETPRAEHDVEAAEPECVTPIQPKWEVVQKNKETTIRTRQAPKLPILL